MSEYEKIEKELLPLGWTVKPGRGDHMMFTKEGVPHTIMVSKSLTCQAYKNVLSDIRRWEPASTLGKPSQSKDKAKESPADASVQEEVLPDRYSFIKVGNQVRYVKPEERDYSRLQDPSSVMNIPYKVIAIRNNGMSKDAVTSTDDRIILDSVGDGIKSHTFEVKIDDIDAWELRTCSKCKRSMPANMEGWVNSVVKGKEYDFCPDCMRLSADIKAWTNKVVALAKKYNGVKYQQILKELTEKITHIVGKDEDVLLISMTEEKLLEMEILYDEVKNELRIEEEKALAPAAKPIVPRKLSLIDAFTNFKENMRRNLCDGEQLLIPELSLKYTTDKCGDLTLMKVLVDTQTQKGSLLVYLSLYGCYPQLIEDIESVYTSKNGKAAVEIIWNEIGFDQIFTKDCSRASLEMLRTNLPEEDFREKCSFVSKMSMLPNPDVIHRTVNKYLEPFKKKQLFSEVSGIFFRLLPNNKLRLEAVIKVKEDRNVDARRWNQSVVDTVFKQIVETLDYEGKIEILPLFHLVSENRSILIKGKNDVYTVFEKDSFSPKPDHIFNDIVFDYETSIRIDAYMADNGMTENEFFKAAVNNLLDKDATPSENKTEIETKNENEMKDNSNIYPETASGTKALNDYETNDLLRELLRRGVKMTGVQVPITVMQEIDLTSL